MKVMIKILVIGCILSIFGLTGMAQIADSAVISLEIEVRDSVSTMKMDSIRIVDELVSLDTLIAKREYDRDSIALKGAFNTKKWRDKRAKSQELVDSLNNVRNELGMSLVLIQTKMSHIKKAKDSTIIANKKRGTNKAVYYMRLNFYERFQRTYQAYVGVIRQGKKYIRLLVIPRPVELPGQDSTVEEKKKFLKERDTFLLAEILNRFVVKEEYGGIYYVQVSFFKEDIETIIIFSAKKTRNSLLIEDVSTLSGIPGQQCYSTIKIKKKDKEFIKNRKKWLFRELQKHLAKKIKKGDVIKPSFDD